MAKKRAPKQQEKDTPSNFSVSNVPSPISGDRVDETTSAKEEKKLLPVFKSPNFQHSGKGSGKKRVWRGMKQILIQEKSLVWDDSVVLYSHIDAPPSFKPAKKYSDLSGLAACYMDPYTKLRYANAEEFQTIRTMPSDIVAGYLALRKAYNPVG